jgi:topoisomerase-4 subunit A
LDSTGRSYSLSAHTLPSARGQGEPLTGRFNPPAGASFVATLGGDLEAWWLLASDAGYGFRIQAKDLVANKKAGKTALSLPKGAQVVLPCMVEDADNARVVAVTKQGRMLVIPANDLPAMSRGKGNKIIGIPGKDVESREDYLVGILAVPAGGKVRLNSGKRYFSLKASDLNAYEGERGRRGNKLPRGFQKVDSIELED